MAEKNVFANTVHKIKIANDVYGNIGYIEPSVEREYYHNVTTLDGVMHQEIRWEKTNYTVQFFNLLDGVYVALRNYIKANKDTPINCGFPDDEDGFVEGEYFLTIQSEIAKGYKNGNYFKNGLTVLFEAVNPDE